jgi:hypothetical protein
MAPACVSAFRVGCGAFLNRVHAWGMFDHGTPFWKGKLKMGKEARLDREGDR